MKHSYVPQALIDAERRLNPYYGDAEYEEYVERAKQCMLFGMSPEYFDNMTNKEHMAWIAAFKEIQKERNG